MADEYFELQAYIGKDKLEIISDYCFEFLECQGIVSDEETYKDLKLVSSTGDLVKLYFLDKSDEVIDYFNSQNIEILSFNKVKNEDWSKKWKENWDLTEIDKDIAVAPSWIDTSKYNYKYLITLDPRNAFGTGTHLTTQLCMLELKKYVNSNSKVADIGCGSAILSIVASKLGASFVYGIDNDETVLETAKDNCKVNNCSNIKIEINTVDKITEKFDIVVANILHNVLADIMSDLKRITKNSGIIILSGILDEKQDVVLEAINKNNLKLVEINKNNNWVSITVKKEEE